MEGKRIAVFGLGRSGLAVARAAIDRGASPVVFDEKPLESLSKRDIYQEASLEGIDVRLGWDGAFGEFNPDLLVSNPAVPKTHPKLLAALDAGIEVISEIEFGFRISRAPIVAITGTNGKSTTTVMTYLCLRACGIDAVLCGNIFGSGYPEMAMTEAAMRSRADQVLVVEVSSFQLEWVRDFRPVSAGIANIWHDHLDRYESFEEYAATKHRIFSAQGRGDFAVVRANDPVVVPPGGKNVRYRPRSQRLQSDQSSTDGPTVLTFGAMGEHGRVEEDRLFLLNERLDVRDLPFREPHNLSNAAMAALLAFGALAAIAERSPEGRAAELISRAKAQEIEKRRASRSVFDRTSFEEEILAIPKEILEGLKQFRGIAHRMEFIGEKNGIRLINNSMCTNPDAVIKSAMSVRDRAHLLIGGVNKGLDFGPLCHYLANQRHQAYLFGTDASELNKMLGGNLPEFRTLEEAFATARNQAKSGEVIMLAPGCASTDQFKDFRERGDVFRKIAKEWLDL